MKKTHNLCGTLDYRLELTIDFPRKVAVAGDRRQSFLVNKENVDYASCRETDEAHHCHLIVLDQRGTDL